MKRLSLLLAPLLAVACDSPGDRATGPAPTDTSTSDTRVPSDSLAPDAGPDAGPDTGTDSEAAAMCALWNEARAERAEGRWSGSTESCEAGDLGDPGRDNTLRQVNLYRALAGLDPVELSAAKNEAAQACALIMQANRRIEHRVPSTWACYNEPGAEAALRSNLATTPAVLSVDLYMVDDGIDNLGHRRWLLSNTLGPIGVGSTSNYSCLHVIGGEGRANPRYVAWPPPGPFPAEAMRPASWMDLDEAGWSIQSDRVDPASGKVVVTRDGEEVPVETWRLDAGYGSAYGLGIRPDGWKTRAGETYRVVVDGPFETIDYSFTLVDCR